MLKLRIVFQSLLLLMFCGFLSACFRHSDPSAATVPAPAPEPIQDPSKNKDIPPVISICDKLKNYLLPLPRRVEVLPEQTVERHFQQVRRINCKGITTSDQIETVKPPHLTLDLYSRTEIGFQSALAIHTDTCDHIMTTMPMSDPILIGALYPMTGNGRDRIRLKGDLASALFTFKLQPGMNRVLVSYFHDCAPDTVGGEKPRTVGESSCLKSDSFSLVEYQFQIHSVEKSLPGTRIIRDTQCSKDVSAD